MNIFSISFYVFKYTFTTLTDSNHDGSSSFFGKYGMIYTFLTGEPKPFQIVWRFVLLAGYSWL